MRARPWEVILIDVRIPEIDIVASVQATFDWLEDAKNRRSSRRRYVQAVHWDLCHMLDAEDLHRAAANFVAEAKRAGRSLADVRCAADDVARLLETALQVVIPPPPFVGPYVNANPLILDKGDLHALEQTRARIDACLEQIDAARERVTRPRRDLLPVTARERTAVLRTMCRTLLGGAFTFPEIGGLIIDCGETKGSKRNGRQMSPEEVRGERYRKLLARDSAGAPSRARGRKSGRKRPA